MLAAKRKAIDSTCSSLRHLQASPPRLSVSEHTPPTEERAPLVEAVKPAEGEGMARFEASEARKLPHMGPWPVPLKKSDSVAWRGEPCEGWQDRTTSLPFSPSFFQVTGEGEREGKRLCRGPESFGGIWEERVQMLG